ncbi:MAG TPA: GTPase Era [Acidimicrobiia bacterium]|jgi:GTP-binding protein Era|nr:GTPase Era [Acidimicrobiia bacterium]
MSDSEREFRSGFVALVGRPNVGKSTLLNSIIGRKVSIVSDKPQTTRTQVRGVRTTSATQLVFLDTPGVHRPRTLLGERSNERALSTLREVDVVCFLIEANAPIGPGDRFVAARLAEVATPVVLAVNKVDVASRDAIGEHLAIASGELGEFAAYVPVSARTGDGCDTVVAELEARMPPGPLYYPADVVTDQPEAFLAAELVREQLLAVARDELPHSIAVTTEDVDERTTASGESILALAVVVRVERESQKGIVIGKGGAVLKAAGTAARHELEALLGTRVHLETRVKVDPDWQRRAGALDRLGL